MLWLFELTISYKPQVADGRERKKKEKFYYLVEAGRAVGYKSELITFFTASERDEDGEVGSNTST